MELGRDEERLALGRHAAAVFAYLERRASGEMDALDLFQKTMVRAWSRIDRFPAEGARRQRIWLLAAAARVLAQRGGERLEGSPPVGAPRPERSSDRRRGGPVGHAQTLRAVVPRLAYAQRELLTMVHWDGLTLLEAAQVLGLDAERAVGEYSAARANLRAVLEGARF